MWLTIFLTALVTTVVGLGLNFIPPDNARLGRMIGAGAATFILSFVLYWLVFSQDVPPFTGTGVLAWFWPGLLVMAVCFGVASLLTDSGTGLSASWIAPILVFVLLFAGAGIWNFVWFTDGEAKALAQTPNVQVQPETAYPNTSDQHIVANGLDNAAFEASKFMGAQVATSRGTQTLGTYYTLGTGALQFVDKNLYYIFPLEPSGWQSSRLVDGDVPGYLAVSAEDPYAPVQPHLNYHMKWYPGGYFGHNLERHVWERGYKDVYLDEPTLEVTDDWQPFYTFSIDKPIVRWQQSYPVGFVTVDAQSGQIQPYGLDRIPSWADRVYSSTVAKSMMTWWGLYARAPYKWFTNAGERYKVDGEPTLVYTDDGPAWQMSMASLNNDAAVAFVALFDTRSNNVRLYVPPGALSNEAKTSDTINRSQANPAQKYVASDLALHKIYGRLTWVTTLYAAGVTPGAPEAYQGIALMDAVDGTGTSVAISQSKGDVLSQLQTKRANLNNGAAPEAGANTKTAVGTIQKIEKIDVTGQTQVIVKLNGRPGEVFVGPVPLGPESVRSYDGGFAEPGDNVTLTYIDTGNPRHQLQSFTDNTQAAASSPAPR